MRSVVQPSEPPSSPASRLLSGAGVTARVRPWPGRPEIAHLVTLDRHDTVPVTLLRGWTEQIAAEGYTSLRTGALHPAQRGPYDALGFAVVQRLTLLHLDLRSARPTKSTQRTPSPVRARRVTADSMPALAALDHASFPAGWSLDVGAIEDAVRATPVARVRHAVAPNGGPLGYAVTGRSGRTAFLQRLAVHPARQRRGVGRLLVDDAVRWARRRRCRTMSVNTQHDNDAALALYGRLGFRPGASSLVVLELALTTDA